MWSETDIEYLVDCKLENGQVLYLVKWEEHSE